jgi:hypothetical protein
VVLCVAFFTILQFWLPLATRTPHLPTPLPKSGRHVTCLDQGLSSRWGAWRKEPGHEVVAAQRSLKDVAIILLRWFCWDFGKLAANLGFNYVGHGLVNEAVPDNLKTSSSILKGEIAFMKQLQKWLGKKCKWHLCYRASRDGWSVQEFHKHCDNKGPTVVLVKANDCIFGGYTDQHWEGTVWKIGLYIY